MNDEETIGVVANSSDEEFERRVLNVSYNFRDMEAGSEKDGEATAVTTVRARFSYGIIACRYKVSVYRTVCPEPCPCFA